MSLLSHQSAINPEQNFWVSAEPGISTATQFVQTAGGSRMAYNGDIQFALSSSNADIGRIVGVNDLLYIQTNTGVVFNPVGVATPQNGINPDATFQNGLPGIYTSTLVSAGDKLQTIGYNTTGHQLTLNQRDSANNLLQSLDFYFPRNLSTMAVLSYQSKDSMSYNAITTPIMNINPYTAPAPTLAIPTYTLSTAQIQTSTLNGVNMDYTFVNSNVVTPTTNSNTIVQTFPIVNQSNYIFEGTTSGRISWVGSPAPSDEITLNWSGGSASIQDNINFFVYPAIDVPAGISVYDFTLSGVFQTSATATSITLNCDVNCATPSNYAVGFYNGYIRPLKHQ